jgi:D-glycero-alpha-D-manno-heptose 1-phosphate guanylyltransferase
LNGDTFLDFEVEAIEHQWQQNHQPIIVARQVEDTARYGRLVIADGLIKGFSEKGVAGPGLINAGCYIFRPDQLDAFPLHTPFSLEADYLVQAVMNMPIEVFVTTGQFIDIGIPEDYQRAQLGTYE